MIAVHGLQYNFDFQLQKILILEELGQAVRESFITSELTRTLLGEWESLALNRIVAKKFSMPSSACLRHSIKNFSTCKHPFHQDIEMGLFFSTSFRLPSRMLALVNLPITSQPTWFKQSFRTYILHSPSQSKCNCFCLQIHRAHIFVDRWLFRKRSLQIGRQHY